ncbi:MAG: hypothetical protein IMY72_10525 [Bacteroidetes bacterium]|nr:hypothetical protein [Bacteroidota bacterium]
MEIKNIENNKTATANQFFVNINEIMKGSEIIKYSMVNKSGLLIFIIDKKSLSFLEL